MSKIRNQMGQETFKHCNPAWKVLQKETPKTWWRHCEWINYVYARQNQPRISLI